MVLKTAKNISPIVKFYCIFQLFVVSNVNLDTNHQWNVLTKGWKAIERVTKKVTKSYKKVTSDLNLELF